MKKLAAVAVIGLLTAGLPMMTPDAIAEDQPTIKVALTDLSASAGMGPMGQMMMGPGYGGGQGMMGPNMMMGMMAIRIDHDTVKAGPVKFDVTNWSRGHPARDA